MRPLDRQIFVILVWVTSLTTEAAQLGFAKGSAIFGRPLDLSMEVKLDSPFDDASNCFSAEVFQGDSRFDAGRVRLDVIPTANGMEATVRVRSVTAVNEPWAKVILRNNCGTKISRQYDFLTDFATDVPAGNILADALPTATSPNTQTINNATNAEAPISNLGVRRLPKVSPQKSDPQIEATSLRSKNIKVISPPSTVATLGVKKSTQRVTEPVVQSLLKIETFELTDEHQVLLKLSTALVAPTGMRTPEEIKALSQAAAVWRAINGLPQEGTLALANTNTNTEVQPTTPTLQASVKIEKPPNLVSNSDFSNLLVYGLITLLALTLACIAWLWLRVRKASLASYDWLNASTHSGIEPTHEQTQFLPTNFSETHIQFQDVEPANPEKDKTEFSSDEEIDKDPVVEIASTALSASPLASLASGRKEKRTREQDNRKKNTPPMSSTNLTEVQTYITSVPPHFDDPRFEERLLRSKKKSHEAVHSKPISSNTELMDLVVEDTESLQHHTDTTPNDELYGSSNQKIDSSKTTPTKDDAKSNMIDFEIFAEPLPTDKPSRFVS